MRTTKRKRAVAACPAGETTADLPPELVRLVKQPAGAGVSEVAAWAWQRLEQGASSVLASVLAMALWTALVPDKMEWGKKAEAAGIMLMHLLVTSAAADLR